MIEQRRMSPRIVKMENISLKCFLVIYTNEIDKLIF